ncbi:MAG: cell division protein FtsZ [Dehalococcoidia bacterium]
MKVVAVGIGQCGCNIADEFHGINNYARSFFGRRVEILTDSYAINTDETDLSGLRFIPKDRHHRILIGSLRTFGHGVGKVNFEAASIMKESYSAITDSLFKSRKFHEADAVVVTASAGGGTGSGSIGWLMKGLKERTEKPVYAIVVLPFAFEERGPRSYAVTNTATCLKMVTRYSDGVFLLDNDLFGRTEVGLARNFRQINQQMVNNFYDLFCAGEEKRQKYVGSKVVDAGDIRQTLADISAIGRGKIQLSTFYRWRRRSFREAVKENLSAAGALSQAENNFSLRIELKDARRILALVSAPKDVLTLGFLQQISDYLQDKSPDSIVRIGDYPHTGKEISITLIASQLTEVPRLRNIYLLAEDLFKREEEIEEETERKITKMYEFSKNLPDLE